MNGQQAGIWWIRKDLRLNDNQALIAAARHGRVVPLFVLDPRLLDIAAPKRVEFLLSGLNALDSELREKGSRLFVREGNPTEVVPEVSREMGNAPVFAEEDHTPFARGRDVAVSKHVSLELLPGLTVAHPTEVLNAAGEPVKVFSRYREKWTEVTSEKPPVSYSDVISFVSKDNLRSGPLPETKINSEASEKGAMRRLQAFAQDEEGIWKYGEQRNRVDITGTSSLSAHLHFGMISARTAVAQARKAISEGPTKNAAASARSWLNELVWREFFQSAIYHFPRSLSQSLRPEFESIDWLDQEGDIAAWQTGNTGYPIVDAAMRQLQQEGWIHNRLRMVVASFLVKDLLVDWRHGAKWFMKHLVDGDTAANIGGWQWTAGTGLDAAPYFRVFNPVLQGKKFDPEGVYVRRWVHELEHVPEKHIHAPWEFGDPTPGYPAPIVDHKLARTRALEAFQSAKARYDERQNR